MIEAERLLDTIFVVKGGFKEKEEKNYACMGIVRPNELIFAALRMTALISLVQIIRKGGICDVYIN